MTHPTPEILMLVRAIHHGPLRFVIAVTGGGSGAAAHLFAVPGASKSILEFVVPYAEQSLVNFLGRRPESFCSADTGREMARQALARARALAPHDRVAGVGCTAALVTDRPKRGDHRFFITVRTEDQELTTSLILTKDARDRAGEEAVLDGVLLNLMAAAAGQPKRVDPGLHPGERLTTDVTALSDPLTNLFRGATRWACVESDGRTGNPTTTPTAVLSGAFNPVHLGHFDLARAAETILGRPVGFELSIDNADKPPLTVEELRGRVARFAWKAPVWVTRAPTFLAKAEVFPGCTFVVGVDTAERILMPRYYGNDEARTAAALRRLGALGCQFLVAGRVTEAGTFRCLEHLAMPSGYPDLFRGLPEAVFRRDLSSTQIRKADGARLEDGNQRSQKNA